MSSRRIVGSFAGVEYRSEELTLVRSATMDASRRTAVRLASELSKTAPVLMLNRGCSKNDLSDAFYEYNTDGTSLPFAVMHFYTEEMTDSLAIVAGELREGKYATVVVTDFEHATDTERHKLDLASELIRFAKSLGACVIVFTRDGSRRLSAGQHGRGALGYLCGMTTRIEIAVDPVAVEREEAERRKPAPKRVSFRDINDFKPCSFRLGKSISEAVQPRDYEFIIQGLREKEELVRGGWWRMRGVPKEEFEIIKQEFYRSNQQEINELEACVLKRGRLVTYEEELEAELSAYDIDVPVSQ